MSARPSAQAVRSGLEALDLADASCRKFPGRTAVEWKGRSSSYAELDAAARALAARMDERGAPRGGRVGVLLDDRVAVIAAMLAAFRTGRVFVPVDPDAPPARNREILSDAQPACLLVGAALIERAAAALEGLASTETVVVDPAEGCGTRVAPSHGAGIAAVDPDALAYLSYTSGSTGRPKGIAGRLRGLSHFVRWELDAFGIGDRARVSQLTVPTFDAYFRDVLVPLAAGGTVCIPPGALRDLDGETLAAWIEESRIETLHCVPSLLATLLYEPLDSGRFPALRRVLVAGEVLHVEEARRWLELFGDRIALVNLYGPSETTMVKFFHRVEPRDLERGFVPIGKPIPGARGLILAPDGSPCPPGVVGELFIRTPYRTLGYYRRPELTARAFLPNPFRDDPDDLLYRTGDLARVLPDGNLQFLGRRDDQIKIRGLRVELSEIEGHLRSHPEVREAAVESVEENREPRLIAFIVPREGSEISPAELRSFLKSRLPAPMIPADWAVLDALPRSSTGKVDRVALGRLRPQLRAGDTAFVKPRTTVEVAIARIWKEVLGVEKVGARDDFFELGGHSLLAARVVSRLRRDLGIQLPVAQLFEHSTVEGLARAIETGRAGWDGGEPADASSATLTRGTETRGLPLSDAQGRLWLVHQLEDASPNNVLRALSLRGPLDVEALRSSLELLVARHESLRTTYDRHEPLQAIQDPQPFVLSRHDFTDLSSEHRDRELLRALREETDRRFDLTRDVLLTARLIKMREDEHVLLLVSHHIAADGWSMGVLLKELAECYAARREGREPSLPALPIRYADFAASLASPPDAVRREEQVAYWNRKLKGGSPLLELPTDLPRPASRSIHGGSHSFRIPGELARRLRETGQREGATLFMTLLAGFQALLHRYAGGDEVSVGSFVANRTRPELEGIVGFFLNIIVLRTDLSGDPSFRELLRRTRETALGALDHQELPFESVLDAVRPVRSLSHTPLFQVAFVLQNAPKPPANLPDLRLRVLEVERRRSHYDLSLMVWEEPDGLRATFVYSRDLFHAETIARMAGHLRTLYAAAVENPRLRVSELPLRTPEEERSHRDAAATPVVYAERDLLLHELFERQVDRVPEALAVDSPERSLSYRELDREANALAVLLRARGAGPERLVGICMERSASAVVAILAALKAGAAWVPVQPGEPTERIAWMLGHPAVALILTDRPGAGRLTGMPAPILLEGEELARVSERVTAGAAPESAAYVIFTSGSTGRPKGVVIPHRAIVNRILWGRDAYGLTQTDRVLHALPLGFDYSIWEIFTALAAGAGLIVAPEGESGDSALLVRRIAEKSVTVAGFVPSQLDLLLREPEIVRCRSLAKVFSGGEVLSPELRDRFFETLTAELENTYGPTEAAVDVTRWVCRPGEFGRAVPIGRPIGNAELVVLDGDLRLAPVGVPGELCIGGAPLARGYLGLPEQTAERFVPDAFSRRPGARLYRTGDRARLRPDGALEYLGRFDDQVKLRGIRIEPGEVARALESLPGVREAYVALGESDAGEKRLVGYLVPEPGETIDVAVIRAKLKNALPGPMQPAVLTPIPFLPRTAAGKVDRTALPAPQGAGDPRSEAEEPRTPLESLIAGVWSELLGVPRIGRREDFFAMGGHSLLATRVLTRLRRELGIDVPLRHLFESPTIAELAARIATEYEAALAPSLLAARPVASASLGLVPDGDHWT